MREIINFYGTDNVKFNMIDSGHTDHFLSGLEFWKKI